MFLYRSTNLFFLLSFLFFNLNNLIAQESDNNRLAIEELVVTSQKRTQGSDAQDTGIAITVISSDKIEAVLGYVNESSLIHRNNMIIIQTVREEND